MNNSYEKAYKEALERARELKNKLEKSCSLATPTGIESIFPELAESEDERNQRIKKEVVEILHYYHSKSPCFIPPQFSLEETLAWLEKQGDYNKLVEEIKKRKKLLSKEKEKAKSASDRISLGGRIAMLEELLAFTKEKQDEQKTITQYNYVKFREGDTVQKITGDKDIVTIAEVDIEAEEYKLTNTGFIPFKYEHLWHIVKQNPAWSKEDITNYSKVLFCLQTLTFPTDAERKELITWLKKQCEQSSADGECKAKRDAEQNPAWSEDDELRFKKAIYIFHQNGYFDVENWLKSLKDRVQPHWKPTEEQLMALRDAIDNNEMESLYNDLKKL